MSRITAEPYSIIPNPIVPGWFPMGSVRVWNKSTLSSAALAGR